MSPSTHKTDKHTPQLPEKLIGRPVRDIYLNPEDRNPLLKTLLTDGSVKNFIVALKKKDGSVASASVSEKYWMKQKARVKKCYLKVASYRAIGTGDLAMMVRNVLLDEASDNALAHASGQASSLPRQSHN